MPQMLATGLPLFLTSRNRVTKNLLFNVAYCVAPVCLVATLNNMIFACEGIPDTLSPPRPAPSQRECDPVPSISWLPTPMALRVR